MASLVALCECGKAKSLTAKRCMACFRRDAHREVIENHALNVIARYHGFTQPPYGKKYSEDTKTELLWIASELSDETLLNYRNLGARSFEWLRANGVSS